MDIERIPFSQSIEGSGFLFSLPAGYKMGALIIFLASSAFLVNSLPGAGLCCISVLVVGIAGGIPWKLLCKQMILIVPFLLFLAIFQVWSAGWQSAGQNFLLLCASMVASLLVVLSTKLNDMMELMEKVLEPLSPGGILGSRGINVDLVSIALLVTIHLIPLQYIAVYEILEARRARGVKGQWVSFLVAIIVRTIARARSMGEGLIARGI